MRELRTLLINNADFQQQLIHAAAEDVMMFAAALQGALFLSSGERQSLMVKLARISPLLRDHLENGAGQRILKAGIGKVDTDAPAGDEPNYTSLKSHKRLMKELDDIINVHIPENREALKVAPRPRRLPRKLRIRCGQRAAQLPRAAPDGARTRTQPHSAAQHAHDPG